MRRGVILLLLAAFALALSSGYAFAQATASGTIQGTISDKSGAVVVGAEVQATQVSTGTTRNVTTNQEGLYRFDMLPPSTYKIKISKAGFATVVQNVELLVGVTATINANLKPGATSETVEVMGVAPLVDTEKTGVAQSITPSQIQDVPLLGRDVASLALLAPGVRPVSDTYDPTKARFAQLSVDGQGGRNVNVTINGVDNKDSTVGGPVMQLPMEAVQEYQISTQRFSAANGRSEGAAINLITKSGGNQYHGSLFASFRDQAFNKIDYYSDLNGAPKADYSRQWFGGSVGGPIKKDKAFVFFAIERQRESTALPESADGYKELSLAKSIGAEPALSIPTPFYEWRYNGRADYKLNDRHSAFIAYTSQDNQGLNDQSDGFGDLTGRNTTTNHMQAANFTLNSVFSPTLVNNFTFGFQYWNNDITTDVNKPLVTFPGGGSFGIWFGTNGNVPQKSFQRKFQFRDDLTKSIGKHTFKGGVDYVWEPRLGGYFTYNSTLEIDFAADPSEILADKVKYPQGFSTLGLINSMSLAGGDPSTNVPGGTKQIGLYFQDDWRVSKRVSLNLGLRWDKDINLIGESSVLASRTYQELKAIGNPLTARIPHDDNTDFSPRIGFAYDMTGSGKHLLRGGFGLYYGNVFQNIPLFMQQQGNKYVYQGLFSISGDEIVPGTSIPLSSWRFGIDPQPVPPPPMTQLTNGSTGRLMSPDYRNPYTEQFNVGYQWALTHKSVFEMEYVHTLGLHENKSVSYNTKDPYTGVRPWNAALAAAGLSTFGRVTVEESINRSRYDGLNISYRQQMVHGVSLTANYTLSRAVGWNVNGSSSFRNYPHDPRNIWSQDNFGPSTEDERHHVTVAGAVNLPGHFELAPMLQFGSARPYNVTSGFDIMRLGTGYSTGVVVRNSNPTDYFAFDGDSKGARDCLAASQCHLMSYNPFRGDPTFQLDMRISNNIKLGEGRNLRLFFQAFNLTNRTNFGNQFNGDISAGADSFRTPNGYFGPTFSPTMVARSFTGEFGFRFTF